MSPNSHLALFAFLLAVAAVSFVEAYRLRGSYQPIDINDPRVKEMAEFAVSEFNKENKNKKQKLVFQRVVRGQTQVVQGLNFKLVIATTREEEDESSLLSPTVNYYEVLVCEGAWPNFTKLKSFLPSDP